MDLDLTLFVKILYTLGIGVLIGLERTLVPSSSSSGKLRGEKETGATPPLRPDAELGVRTFSIMALGGLVAALVGERYPMAAPVILFGLIAFVVLMHVYSLEKDPGVTTEIAAVACCGLGMLCHDKPHTAVVIALLVTILLALKRIMPRILRRLKRIELTDTLKFLVIILIVLPLLPNKALDPYDVFNPYKITFLVILISGISFVGYFFTKFLGAERGLGLTGLFGGLTSSTAVTAAMADQAKKTPELMSACAFATVIANATMFGRVLVVVGILEWELMLRMLWSIGTMLLVAMLALAILWKRSQKKKCHGDEETSQDLGLTNPFSLGPAIKFALFFIAILFVAKFAKMYLGDKGVYLASMASGLADVDAITLSIIDQTRNGSLMQHVAAIGITIAVVSNSIVKSAIAFYSGGWKFGLLVGQVLLGATGAGLAVLFIL